MLLAAAAHAFVQSFLATVAFRDLQDLGLAAVQTIISALIRDLMVSACAPGSRHMLQTVSNSNHGKAHVDCSVQKLRCQLPSLARTAEQLLSLLKSQPSRCVVFPLRGALLVWRRWQWCRPWAQMLPLQAFQARCHSEPQAHSKAWSQDTGSTSVRRLGPSHQGPQGQRFQATPGEAGRTQHLRQSPRQPQQGPQQGEEEDSCHQLQQEQGHRQQHQVSQQHTPRGLPA